MKLISIASINFRHMKKIFWILGLTIVLVSCENNPLEVEVKDQVNVPIKCFEKDLYSVTDANIDEKLKELSEKYPKFINGDINDPSYRNSLLSEVNNPLNQVLMEDRGKFGLSDERLKNEVNRVLSYYQYYYPNDRLTEVYTFVSGLHMSMDPIMLDRNSIVISVDKYYGKDYPVYQQAGYHSYQTQNMTHDFFPVDLARYIALSRFDVLSNDVTLLETMIYLGKIEYFIEALNPGLSEQLLMGFKEEQMAYCTSNEKRVWTYLVEKELLYSKDMMEIKNYTENRPFISSVEKDSPGRMGVWYGKKIVKEYMAKENVSLQDLMKETDYLKIFQKAKYRP